MKPLVILFTVFISAVVVFMYPRREQPGSPRLETNWNKVPVELRDGTNEWKAIRSVKGVATTNNSLLIGTVYPVTDSSGYFVGTNVWPNPYDGKTNFLKLYPVASNRIVYKGEFGYLVRFTDEEWRLIETYYDPVTNVRAWYFWGPTNRIPK